MTRPSDPWHHAPSGARASEIDPSQRVHVLRALFDAATSEIDDCIETLDSALDDENEPAPSVPQP
jgi:hypothetical protein